MPLAIPQKPSVYMRSPGQTLQRLREWLSARVWLRQCDHVGRWTRVTGKVIVHNYGRMTIGERVLIQSEVAHSVLTTFDGGLLDIGDHTFLNYGADISATNLVRIGKDCLIGTHVMIVDNDFHEVTNRAQMPEGRPVIIGDNVWIANRAIILPGVTIGEGAVVGAGSVVVHDVPARSVVVGNPAKVVKSF